MNRFQDDGRRMRDFADHAIVVCPKCNSPIDLTPVKISCTHCGFNESFDRGGKHIDELNIFPMAYDYYCYLSIRCCGKVLFANNLDHLDFLEGYVRADLRVREPNINKSLVSRMPQWMKSAKNREEILRCIGKLRNRLISSNYKSAFHQ